MKLRKSCKHGFYDSHWGPEAADVDGYCPGGEFLADDALVIEREPDGKFPEWITDVDGPVWFHCGGTDDLLEDIFKAVEAGQTTRTMDC